MKLLFVLTLLLSLSAVSETPTINRNEAIKAYTYINAIRKNPKSFKQQFSFLGDYKGMYTLKWNDTLAKVAEAKAMYMASNNYFGHVDQMGFGINHYISEAGYSLRNEWTRDPKANYFESIASGGLTAEELINVMIIDSSVPSLGHRNHLLGLDKWNASLVDIGIGYVTTGPVKFNKAYTCVIIAKHQ